MDLSRRQVLGLAGGLAGLAGCLETTPTRDHLATGEDLRHIAHRGSMYLWPENTLRSIERSIETGADIVEIDLDVTADDTIVVFHDRTVDRTTDGTGDIADHTLEEAKELDAGYNFPPEMEDAYVGAAVDHEFLPPDEQHPYRGQGIEIPTLEEVFELVPSDYPLLLDVKRDRPDPGRIAELIEAYHRVETTMIGAFETSFLEAMRAELPELETGLGAAEVRQLLFTMRASEHRYDPSVEFFFAPHRTVRESLVDRAHRNGMSVLPWTVNDPKDMERLAGLGVDGILTDDHVFQKRVLENG